jgi:cell pole-organizing protein PopZ
MSDQAAPEPTMEEILASIRRIISEDDAPASEPAEAAHEEPAESFAPAPEPEPEPAHEDVLELTERVSLAESVGDIDAYEKPEPEPEPAPAPVMVAPRKIEERLVSEPSATAAASAFDNLTAAIAMPPMGRTLEDLAGELLRPLLKAWLDANLPRIVEAKVAEEVERIARSRVR